MIQLGWAMMSAYSTEIYERLGAVPFIHLWGNNGSGKTTVLRWLMAIYAMHEHAIFSLANIGSSVGMMRKMAYYSSLPICIDEIRMSQEMKELSGKLRTWYNRGSRDIAASGSQSQVYEQPVRSTLLFGGQDAFVDPALRERCIVIRLIKDGPGRDMKNSYHIIDKIYQDRKLSAIGLYWIQESLRTDKDQLYDQICDLYREFLSLGVSYRTAWTWAAIGVFSVKLSNKFFPDYDIKSFLMQACKEDSSIQSENTTLNAFFETVEGIMSKERSPFTCEHFKVDRNKDTGKDRLYMWFKEVHRLTLQEKTDGTAEIFTKEAIKSAMKEEPYFLSDTTVKMGKNSVSRRVLVFDIGDKECPMALRSIAEAAKNLL